MSQFIVEEVNFLFGSVIMGILITFVYDFILILRRIVRHNIVFVSLEDLLFWISCAITVFYLLYRENNGILRWFAVFGAGIGMLFYKSIVGKKLVQFLSFIINKEIHLLSKILGLIMRPFQWLFRKIRKILIQMARNSKRILKSLKNKLTILLKMLKIALCKH